MRQRLADRAVDRRRPCSYWGQSGRDTDVQPGRTLPGTDIRTECPKLQSRASITTRCWRPAGQQSVTLWRRKRRGDAPLRCAQPLQSVPTWKVGLLGSSLRTRRACAMRCKSRAYPNSQPFDGPSCSVVSQNKARLFRSWHQADMPQ
jgi:hypothetical protein